MDTKKQQHTNYCYNGENQEENCNENKALFTKILCYSK